MAEFPCRVCGLEQPADMWNPKSYGICPCCGTEFGLNDDDHQLVCYQRMAWLSSGAKWFKEERKPDVWTLNEVADQLKNIPEEWWW